MNSFKTISLNKGCVWVSVGGGAQRERKYLNGYSKQLIIISINVILPSVRYSILCTIVIIKKFLFLEYASIDAKQKLLD